MPNLIVTPSFLLLSLGCLGALDYGANCSSDPGSEPCDPAKALECVRGFCGCSPLRKIWDLAPGGTERMCVGLPEESCNPNSTNVCMIGTSCGQDGKCHCDKGQPVYSYDQGFYLNPASCMLEFGEYCGSNNSPYLWCNNYKGLACFEDRCVCQSSPSQGWDEEKMTCASGEGQPCRTDIQGGYTLPCAGGMECKPTYKGSNFGVCIRN